MAFINDNPENTIREISLPNGEVHTLNAEYLDGASLQDIEDLINEKASISDIPTKMSELENDSGYQTAPQVAAYMDGRLTRYYTAESTDTLLNRKADSANTLGGYHITDAYTKTEIDNIVGAAYHYVNSVDLLSDLPVSATNGDVIYVGETQLSYVWNGTTWSPISALGDLSGIILDADNMRKVLPNSTLSGATVSFENDVDGLYFDDVEISIVEQQLGSGAPSPTNVRPLVGYTSANIYLSPDTTEESARVTTVEFPDELGTIYRGTLNVTTGKLRVTAAYMKLVGDGTEGISVYSVPRYKVRAPGFVAGAKATKMSIKANCLDTYPLGQSGTAYRICQGDFGTNYIVFNLGSAVSTVALANEWLAANNLEIIYPLATPKIYQLTPAQIQMLLGQNYLWADTGNVSTSFLRSIEDLIDSTAKTIEDAPYTNVYDPTDPDIVVGGKQINRGGTISNWSNGQVSGYIPCKAGDTFIMPFYTSHFGTGTSARGVPLFDANKQYVSYVTGTLISVESAQGNHFLQFTVTGETSAYFRVTVCNKDDNNDDIETPFHAKSMFMVIKGSTFPNRYYPYGQQRVIADNVYSAHESLSNPLFGKKAVFLGDSICEGDYLSGWAGRIGRENCMCWENEGVGGSCISTVYSTGKTICIRAIKTVAPDYIIFEGGTNDADRIGNITGGSIPPAFGSFTADNWGTNDAANYYGFNIGTYCGALEYMCKRLITTYAGAKVGYIVAQKMGSGANYRNRRAYFETAMQICKKWGIPVLNLWDGCYLNPALPAHYTSGSADSMYIDGQHLTPKGYDYITPMISAWMKTL